MRNFLRELVSLFAPYKKAVVAGVMAAVFAALPVVLDGNVSAADVSLIVGAFLSGAGVTYKVANVPAASGARKAE